MKLGNKPPKHDERTLRLAKYFLKALPPPPPFIDFSKGMQNWGMMLNDQLGDCTIAGCAHALQTWTMNTTEIVTLPDSTVLSYYEQWDGYNPSDPSTDQGGVEIDVLNNWRQNGLDGHTILGFADPDPGDRVHVKQAISIFGGIYIGLALPLTAQMQNKWEPVQDYQKNPNAKPGSWGGHCVYVVAYNEYGLLCVTWGRLLWMSWGFWAIYCNESHAILSENWIPYYQGKINTDMFMVDLNEVSG
jgi:hypothetical protein